MSAPHAPPHIHTTRERPPYLDSGGWTTILPGLWHSWWTSLLFNSHLDKYTSSASTARKWNGTRHWKPSKNPDTATTRNRCTTPNHQQLKWWCPTSCSSHRISSNTPRGHTCSYSSRWPAKKRGCTFIYSLMVNLTHLDLTRYIHLLSNLHRWSTIIYHETEEQSMLAHKIHGTTHRKILKLESTRTTSGWNWVTNQHGPSSYSVITIKASGHTIQLRRSLTPVLRPFFSATDFAHGNTRECALLTVKFEKTQPNNARIT